MCNYTRKLGEKYAPMTVEQEQKAFAEYKATGNKAAYHKIFASSYNLVLKVAHRYKNQGVPIEDLIQEGVLALGEAISKFETDRNNRFITYAIWWIRQSMLDLMAKQSRDFSITGTEATNKANLNKIINKMAQKLNRMPTNKEISEHTGVSMTKLDHMDNLEASRSLDVQLGDGKTQLKDVVRDINTPAPDTLNRVFVEIVKKLFDIAGLSTLAQDIILSYYGVGRTSSTELSDIAAKYKLTRERIRQIKEETLEKIRRINELQKKFNKFHIEADMLAT